MYSITDLVQLLGISRSTILRKMAAGEIKAVRMGGQWRISEEEVQRLRKEGFK